MNAQLPLPVTAPFTRAQRASLQNLVARAAQAEIMPRFRKLDAGQISTKSGPRDLVTEADTAAEAIIARGLQIAFPNAVIVGEETAASIPDYRKKLSEAELGFLIDPIDGTWNFARGLPVFGTMVAACRFGRPVFSLIYDPIGQDLIWADIDNPTTWLPRGSYARALETQKDAPLSEMVGFMEPNIMPQDDQRAALEATMSLGQVSTLRCSAHHYRLLAEGAVDFVVASKLNPWDHAPGVLLCQRAGGHAAMLDGRPYDTSIEDGYLLCAGSEATWAALADLLKALHPKSDAA